MTRRNDPDPPSPPNTQAEQIWREFLQAIDTLPLDIRVTFLLHDFYGLAHDDIALLTGHSPDTCRRHVQLARQATLARIPLRADPTRLLPP